MCNPTVAVSVSVENNKALRGIAHGLFTSKDQLVNWRMKVTVDDWDWLRDKVKNLIDDHLKVRMIKHAQKEMLCITKQEAYMIITSYNDIDKSYKFDSSQENISRIAIITSGQFTNDNGYRVSIDRAVMRDLNLCFPGIEKKITGCIATIVTQRKVEMVSKLCILNYSKIDMFINYCYYNNYRQRI